MAQDRRTFHALTALLPAGALGFSISLAAADAMAAKSSADLAVQAKTESVALRLEAIRNSVSVIVRLSAKPGEDFESAADATRLAWWGNGGWRNGGWHNGGWHNGGWGNGGWHNGGWGNGFHNW